MAYCCSISQWTDIDTIAQYSTLKTLRMTHVPLFKDKGISEVRPIIVGRIGQLEVYNGSSISNRERIDAEKAYLRRIKREVQVIQEKEKDGSSNSSSSTNNQSVEECLLTHPRYAVLNDKYGAELLPNDDSNNKFNTTLADELVTITFHNIIIHSAGETEDIVRKLPSSIQIYKLKQIVKTLYHLDLNNQYISLSLRLYHDKQSPPVVLDDEKNSLSYYGINMEGGDIYINEIKQKH